MAYIKVNSKVLSKLAIKSPRFKPFSFHEAIRVFLTGKERETYCLGARRAFSAATSAAV